ncbi:MAG: ABC transporter permease subunit [Candidatus Bathyarchaeia archaeon]
MADMFTIASKEFSDIVRGKRFIILVVVFGLLMTAAIATVYLNVVESLRGFGVAMPRGFLGMAAYTLVTTMSYLAPIVGIALGCDAISGEREKGTLKLVLAQPVYRDAVVNGKFLAALLATFLAVTVATIAGIGGSVLALGVTPTVDDAARLLLFILFSVLLAMTYYGISVFISTVSKRTTQSVIIGVLIWAVFTFVVPIIASTVAAALVPIQFRPQFINVTIPGRNATRPSQQEMNVYVEALRQRASIQETINSVTPNYHLTKIAQYVLNMYVDVAAGFGIGGGRQGQTITRSTTIAESLVQAWPNILVLSLATALAFIASYIFFTRQEVK